MSEETIGEVPEVSKRPRKILIAILLIVIVGVAAVSVFVWWYTQKAPEGEELEEEAPPTPTPPPPLQPGYERFSKYGFSIDYPQDMIITEEGLIDATANDNSGTIKGESFGPYKGFMVSWGKREPPFTRGDLESELDAFFAAGPERKGSLVETTKLGHEMIYHRWSVIANGDKFYGIVGLWYCNFDKKVYVLATKQTTEQDVLQIFEQYLDSFICH